MSFDKPPYLLCPGCGAPLDSEHNLRSGAVCPTLEPLPVDEKPGIVPGRVDPYVYAGHFSSLNMARIADGMVRETGSYAIKHDELWTLQLAAEKAMRALWTAISGHSIHCHGCEVKPADNDHSEIVDD